MMPKVFFVFVVCFFGKLSTASPVGTEEGQCNATPLAHSSNEMGFELGRQLGGEGNQFISPLSIYTALAMTYLGAGTRTAEQLEIAFQLKENGLNGADLHQSFQQLLELYETANDQYSLSLADGVFVQKNYTVKQKYIEDVQKYYKAVVELLDFIGKRQEATNEINKWVAAKTNNKIEKLLSEPLSPMTRMALMNAVYFKGTWKTQFNESLTREGAFYSRSNQPKTVKFMHLERPNFRFYEDYESGYKFLEMPYKGEDIVMLLALPRSAEDFPDLVMSSSLLCRINSSLSMRNLERVVIPKFRLEYEEELKRALIGLGIKDLFTSAADLSGIREEHDLMVSSVLHKAVIDVNEQGSEAAAVTGVFLVKLSLIQDPEFIADHPFLFYIIDKRNGLVLFSGRLVQP